MAFWGAPLDDPDHARHAVDAALAMQARLPAIHAEMAARGWPALRLNIGINTGTVVVGESVNFDGGLDWLREAGVNVIDLQDAECIEMLGDWIAANSETWNEDIGED